MLTGLPRRQRCPFLSLIHSGAGGAAKLQVAQPSTQQPFSLPVKQHSCRSLLSSMQPIMRQNSCKVQLILSGAGLCKPG